MSGVESKLRTLRLQKGISQDTLALELGYVRQKRGTAVSQAENGNRVQPGFRKKLAQFFGVTEDYLFDEEGYVK